MELAGREGDKHIIEIQIGHVILKVRARVRRRTMNLLKVSGKE